MFRHYYHVLGGNLVLAIRWEQTFRMNLMEFRDGISWELAKIFTFSESVSRGGSNNMQHVQFQANPLFTNRLTANFAG